MKEIEKLNSVVSMYKKPVLGDVIGKNPAMALSVDKTPDSNGFYYGIARIITKRQGNPDIPGFIDRSKLIIVKSKDLLNWEEHSDLQIHGIQEIINSIPQEDKEFIGLEDPDIIVDKEGTRHVYFTIAYKLKERFGYNVYLGHAQGKDLENLSATEPLLGPIPEKNIEGAKESTFNEDYVLNEVIQFEPEEASLISLSKVEDLGKPFQFQKILLDPREMNHSWCAGHLSPCCIFDKDFVSYKNMLVGIVNGREKTKNIRGNRVYGKFRPGLILFNPETGEIPWIDDNCLFEDPKATTITFASDFIQTSKDKGILYAHPNDSFVRAYQIDAKELKKYLDEKVDLD
jgi:hypothetical protein